MTDEEIKAIKFSPLGVLNLFPQIMIILTGIRLIILDFTQMVKTFV